MELLEGIDLESLINRYGPQPPERVVHLLRQVCGSLAEAHGIGLIHRDIKPGNLMLTQRGGVFDYMKVLDFGLVKTVSSDERSLTMANTLTGTPLYMSPESIERPDEVDARSDLYAVGAVGYFLLTGKPVFDGQSVVEICMQQVTATPVPPSQRLMKPIPAELENALLRCLAKKPDDRPTTARELSDLLAAIPLPKPWTEYDAERWWASFTNPALLETRDPGTQRVALETQLFSS
jgi:serine/threonine protein kinase